MVDLTRRGFLAVASTALIVRPTSALVVPSTALVHDPVYEAEIVEDEVGFPRRITPLELFIKSRGVKPAHLALECGYSRQHLLRLRMGRMEPTRRCMVAIMVALRRITREKVRVADLFEVGG